jgi:RNA polymerase sigma-70 factor (ECF subfamily)
MLGSPMTGDTARPDTQVIWQEFGDRLRAFIVRRVRSEADADDILQDVFLRIHQHAAGVHRTDRLMSWLFQVTRNAIVDYYRAPVRREQPESLAGVPVLDRAEAVMSATELEDDSEGVREELARCLQPMLGQLSPLYREAVALVDLSGVTQTEAAARLGLSVSGMKSRVQRGRRALKETLVECCPVRVDTVGRIVDYRRPDSTCSQCDDASVDATIGEQRASHERRCCAPAPIGPGEGRIAQ